MKTWILYWIGLRLPKALATAGPVTPSDSGVVINNPLSASCDEAVGCVQAILNGLIYLAAPVAAIMILVGGFQIMASSGNEEKLKSGKNTIIYAVIGYAIILLASGVAAVINDAVSGGRQTTTPPPECPLICPEGYVCSRDASIVAYQCIPR